MINGSCKIWGNNPTWDFWINLCVAQQCSSVPGSGFSDPKTLRNFNYLADVISICMESIGGATPCYAHSTTIHHHLCGVQATGKRVRMSAPILQRVVLNPSNIKQGVQSKNDCLKQIIAKILKKIGVSAICFIEHELKISRFLMNVQSMCSNMVTF